MTVPDENFISAEDQRLAQQGVQVRVRPIRVLEAWASRPLPGWPTDKKRPGIALTGPEFTVIQQWYDEHHGRDQMLSDPRYLGAFYFEGSIWKLHAPLVFGTIKVDLLKCLGEMPMLVKRRLAANHLEVQRYTQLAIDCITYHNSRDAALSSVGADTLAGERFQSADSHLQTAAASLADKRPKQASSGVARLATEIFLKSYLAHHCGKTNADLIALSHKLGESFRQCLAHDPNGALQRLAAPIEQYPAVGTRYDATDWTPEKLASDWATAQAAGVIVVESFINP